MPLIYSTPASRALSQFMFDAGLDRSSAIAYDLDSIMRASKGDAPVEVEPSQQVRELTLEILMHTLTQLVG